MMNDLFAPQNDEPKLTVLSMGAGQDSTALLLGLQEIHQ